MANDRIWIECKGCKEKMKFQAAKLIEGVEIPEADKIENGLAFFNPSFACGAWINAADFSSVSEFVKWTESFVPQKYRDKIRIVVTLRGDTDTGETIGWKYYPPRRNAYESP